MLKLLVVDDEVDICDFVKSFFKDRNFEVSTAHDGNEAVKAVETDRPDIVLLDMCMPVMGGLEALRKIRHLDSSVKVIMVTAVDDTEKMSEARRHGAMEYITKPLLLEQLERTVMTMAEQIRMG